MNVLTSELSQWESLVPERMIEPESLAIWMSIITTRPPRHNSIHPPRSKCVITLLAL